MNPAARYGGSSTRARGPSPSPVVAGALLAVLVAAAFWPVVTGARSFFHMDLYYEHLPVWAATQRALRSGESPYWLDGEYCGQPLLFTQEAPVFYPLLVPLLRTGAPVHRLADLFTLFHVWLAGFATFLFLRELTEEPFAGLFGGIALMLSARLVQSAIWPNAVAATALVPLLLYGLTLIAKGRRRPGIALAAISGGLALLAARPHVLFAIAPFVAALALALLSLSPRRGRAVADFALAGILALALGAPSLLPTAALFPETFAADRVSQDKFDPQPLAHGKDLDLVFLPTDGGVRWPEAASYPGAIAGLLALSSVFVFLRARRPLRALLLACWIGGAVGLVLAFGDRGPYRFLENLPIVRGFRVPERFLLSWSFAIAVCAALALGQWMTRARRGAALAAALSAVLAADLVWHAEVAAPTAPSAVYEIEPAILGALRARLTPDPLGFPRRYLSLADRIFPLYYSEADRELMLRRFEPAGQAVGMRFGLEAVNGYGPTLSRTNEFLGALGPRAADLAGVGAVVESAPRSPDEPPTQARRLVLAERSGFPRAILVPSAVAVTSGEALRATFAPSIDPSTTAVLETGESLERDPAWNDSRTSLRLLGREPGRVSLTATLPAPGVLVLFDTYEAGWRAHVDGAPATVLRADAAFRGLRLPAGTHRVEFRYEPRGVRTGLGLCLAGVLGLVLVAMRSREQFEGESGRV